MSALVVLSGYAYAVTHNPSLSENMAYRLSWGDLRGVVAAPQERPNALRIARGSEVILERCLASNAGWARDPLIFRLAHAHAASSISCRETGSPGMHVIFYRRPDGAREAWAHFDLCGAGNRLGHVFEVIQNNLTQARTSQIRVMRNLERRWVWR